MKFKFKIALLILVFAFTKGWTQAPNIINYQGVALNNAGAPIANQTISIRASIHDATASGTVVFSEDRAVTTDAGGLFDLQIGSPGSVNNFGTLNNVAWYTSPKFLQIKMDPAGGVNYTDMGTQQLASVPYALNAKSASSLTPDATVNLTNISNGGASTNQVLQFNGTNWTPANVTLTPFSLPYAGTDASSNSFQITNTNAVGRAIKAIHSSNGIAIESTTGTGYAVYGECTGASGTAVYGKSNGNSNASIGVYGESANGSGIKGYGNSAGSIAVFGSSLAGTGVKAYSFTGTALDVNGNVKIAGGNTNPSNGAVLTSDASGNATWKAPTKVAFLAYSSSSATALPTSTWTVVKYPTETFDLGNNFNTDAASTDKNTFIAPVSGVYQFSANAACVYDSWTNNIIYANIDLSLNGSGTGSVDQAGNLNNGSAGSCKASFAISRTLHLNAGDKIKVAVYQHNGGSDTIPDMFDVSFSGHLVFAD